MDDPRFEAFAQARRAAGWDEVLVREWAPDSANDAHSHPFDTDAEVVRGEFWLTIDGRTTHLRAGDRFQVLRGVMHSERYGPDGATFWAARRH